MNISSGKILIISIYYTNTSNEANTVWLKSCRCKYILWKFLCWTLEGWCVCVSLSSLCLWVHVSAYGWNSWSAPLQSSVGDWTARAMSSLFCSGSFSRFSKQSTAVDRDVLDPLHLSYTIIQRHNNNRQGISQQHSLTHIQTSRASRSHPDQFRALVKLLVKITGD